MGAGKTCRQYTPTPYAYLVASSAEYSALPEFRVFHPFCESSYLKAYRDDKQKPSASYSLSTVEGILQV